MYTPRSGSKTEAAIEFIKKKGSGRTKEIAAATGIDQGNVYALLSTAVSNGFLIICDVISNGTSQKEYRISATKPESAIFDKSEFRINPGSTPPVKKPTAASKSIAPKKSQIIPENTPGGIFTPTSAPVDTRSIIELKPAPPTPRMAIWCDGQIQIDDGHATITLSRAAVSKLLQMARYSESIQ